jgi:hypothetical protein
VDAAAATEGDPEEALQAARDLAVRQAALLVEFDDGGLGVGPQLRRGSTQGVGRLQGMASLHATAALTALTNVDVELSVNGLALDLDLELLGDVRFVQQAATVGEDVGQACLMDFVDLFGGRRLAVGLSAVVLARLATGLLGLVCGLALGEGGSLAFASTGRLVDLAAEAIVLGLQVVDPLL